MRFIGIRTTLFLLSGLLAIVCLTGTWAGQAEAAWRFDTERYLRSYHGDLSCAACHQDVVNAPVHPDGKQVNRELTDFFSPETCYKCHGSVKAQLAEGRHGRLKAAELESYGGCLTCHHPHYDGAFSEGAKPRKERMDAEDAACMSCHQIPVGDTRAARKQGRAMCFHCHKKDNPMGWADGPLLDPKSFNTTPHATVACTTCHLDSDEFPHNKQSYGDCTQCHTRHDESVAHDAHLTVACESCHLSGAEPKRADNGDIIWAVTAPAGEVTNVHDMLGVEEDGCERCHTPGNTVGAANMVLPPKSIICMGCHTATLTAGDTISIVTLLIFLGGGGLFFVMAVGGAGNLASVPVMLWNAIVGTTKVIFSRRIFAVGKALFFDVLLQRRLWKRSPKRWLYHSLIFLPFLFRFVWGIVALALSNWAPESTLTWYMVNKNAPGTAFLFDLSGVLIFAGLTLAYLRGRAADKGKLPGLPKQDKLALGLIAGTVAIGHILEGMRIAMTGAPAGSEYAFIGYALSGLFGGVGDVSGAYGWVWYLHALFTGAFIAYLPFSRLMHIILAPVTLSMNAAKDDHHA